MNYILILTLWANTVGSQPAVTAVEFSSVKACQKAGQTWAADMRKYNVRPAIQWICVPR